MFIEVIAVENRRHTIGKLKIKYFLNIGQTYLEKNAPLLKERKKIKKKKRKKKRKKPIVFLAEVPKTVLGFVVYFKTVIHYVT